LYTYIIKIKRLNGSDADDMIALIALHQKVFEDQYQPLASPEYYLKQLSRDEVFAITATLGNVIIGGLTGYILPTLTQEGKQLYIEDLAIETKHQRKGIGTELMKHTFNIARSIGITKVFIEAETDDIEARAFYTSLKPIEDISAHHYVYSLV
jgi:aminoglycoside 3-N-acetyltransferase I